MATSSSLFFLLTFCFLLTSAYNDEDDNENLIYLAKGQVEGGNYTYGFIGAEDRKGVKTRIELTSFEGDADLYVSEEHQRPTFDFERHSGSSASCGVDIVELEPSEDKRAFLGIYGHPRFDVSVFQIAIYKGRLEFDPFSASIEDDEDALKRKPSERRGLDDEYDFYDKPTWWRFLQELMIEILHILLQVAL